MKYVFRDYDLALPELFLEEKKRISEKLKSEFQIEHVGSTSVPGLGGKGIIDIAIGAKKEVFDQISKVLEEVSYEFRPNASNEKRLFFQIKMNDKDGMERTYHIHLTDIDGEEWKRMLAFRDYLRFHTEDAKEYADAKRKAVKNSNQDKEIYMRIKEPVIIKILNKALKSR